MNPKIYLVGGAVRDILLGKEPRDRDFVVVGADHQWMIDRGFTHIDAGFPVYLDPTTQEEYALARTEKKVGKGYSGFSFDTENVSLEEDLFRRDFTINAMAIDMEDMRLIDPYCGQKDLQNRYLKHVSSAFEEDPIRSMRMARFAATYDMTIDPVTKRYAVRVAKEIDNVPTDRIWLEIKKGLACPNVYRFIGELMDFKNSSRIISSILDLKGFPRCPKVDVRIMRTCIEPDTLSAFLLNPTISNGASKMASSLNAQFWEFASLDTDDSAAVLQFWKKHRMNQIIERNIEFMKLIKLVYGTSISDSFMKRIDFITTAMRDLMSAGYNPEADSIVIRKLDILKQYTRG